VPFVGTAWVAARSGCIDYRPSRIDMRDTCRSALSAPANPEE
jgi:hypothetical protein